MELCAWIFAEMDFLLRELETTVMTEIRSEGTGAPRTAGSRQATPAGTGAGRLPHSAYTLVSP